jgi:hypothetical protein
LLFCCGPKPRQGVRAPDGKAFRSLDGWQPIFLCPGLKKARINSGESQKWCARASETSQRNPGVISKAHIFGSTTACRVALSCRRESPRAPGPTRLAIRRACRRGRRSRVGCCECASLFPKRRWCTRTAWRHLNRASPKARRQTTPVSAEDLTRGTNTRGRRFGLP